MKTVSLILILASLTLPTGVALGASSEPVYTNKTKFRIPFRYDPAELQQMGAREIRLFLSRDRGLSWQQVQSVPPDAGKFNFQAPNDGEYWFVVRTLDSRNRLQPEGSTMEPGLQVIVDTALPSLRLDLKQSAPGKVQLAWTATDDNLDPTQLRLEYLQPGATAWQPVGVVPKPTGQTQWSVPHGGVVAVRGSVSDFARNVGQDQAQVRIAAGDPRSRTGVPDLRQPIASPDNPLGVAANSPTMLPGGSGGPALDNGSGFSPMRTGQVPALNTSASLRANGAPVAAPRLSGAGDFGPPLTSPTEAAPRDPLGGRFRIVNSKQFQIGYRLQDVGPSGVSSVEVFITSDDGASWSRFGEDPDNVSPVTIDVPREGRYGFALAVRSGVGLGEPPQPGDKPSIVVVVDQTPPTLEMLPLEQGRGRNMNKILIQWRLHDDNPADRPVAISYSANPQGPWVPITGWHENTGSYVWSVGAGTPPRFYLRLEARDAAGNVQLAETPQPVLIDLSRPTAKILDVEPSQGNPFGPHQ